jgi:exosortase B
MSDAFFYPPAAPQVTQPTWRLSIALWLPLVALVLIYVPSFTSLSTGLWRDSTHSHGPVVLAVALWLFASRFRQWAGAANARIAPKLALGILLLLLGLSLYVLGRSQDVALLEMLSLPPLLMGLTLICFGTALFWRLRFAYFFLLFLVPLPGSIVDALTQPMKLGVSYVNEHLLFWAGYPISRVGVVLVVGQYQLLVADACAGLNSLFMMEAFGLLYLNVVRHPSILRNIVLAVLIVPISFASNVLRVLVLSLVTYHWGDEAGRGFVHGFSGVLLFTSALLLIAAGDTLLRTVSRKRRTAERPSV